MSNPFLPREARVKTREGIFSPEEVRLANRNHGCHLETLAQDITPTGAHYLLIHFDVPQIDEAEHCLSFTGAFDKPFTLTMEEIRAQPQVTMPVTLECAGNGRAGMNPRSYSMPWFYEAVGTSEWTGTPLAPLLERAAPQAGVQDFAFIGADEGFDAGVRHAFGRSLTPREAAELDVMLVWGMNGQPLLPQHGAPLRLIVPGWYGMASVKWLTRIEALTERYQGFQQVRTYRIRYFEDYPGRPVNTIKVKSLMRPPGVPDWITRQRWLEPGPVTLEGRAWSGNGVPVEKVEVRLDGAWREAEVAPPRGRYAWSRWRIAWEATPGAHELACRATDANGDTQPEVAPFNLSGFANNAWDRVQVQVGTG